MRARARCCSPLPALSGIRIRSATDRAADAVQKLCSCLLARSRHQSIRSRYDASFKLSPLTVARRASAATSAYGRYGSRATSATPLPAAASRSSHASARLPSTCEAAGAERSERCPTGGVACSVSWPHTGWRNRSQTARTPQTAENRTRARSAINHASEGQNAQRRGEGLWSLRSPRRPPLGAPPAGPSPTRGKAPSPPPARGKRTMSLTGYIVTCTISYIIHDNSCSMCWLFNCGPWGGQRGRARRRLAPPRRTARRGGRGVLRALLQMPLLLRVRVWVRVWVLLRVVALDRRRCGRRRRRRARAAAGAAAAEGRSLLKPWASACRPETQTSAPAVV